MRLWERALKHWIFCQGLDILSQDEQNQVRVSLIRKSQEMESVHFGEQTQTCSGHIFFFSLH